MIYDLVLYPTPQASFSTLSNTSLNFTRAEHLYCCLRAIRLFFENFFSFKPQEYYGLHLHYWIYFLRCTRIVYRFLVFDDPAWDRATIRDSVNLMDTMQRAIDTCMSVPTAVGFETDGRDMFSSMGSTLRHAKSIWTKTLEQIGAMAPAIAAGPVSIGANQPNSSQPFLAEDFMLLDIYDDAWIGNIFPWNGQAPGTQLDALP
jgi:hypothetical protein